MTSQPQGALLVGSINLPDAETTIRAAAAQLGDRLRRIPDGEVGERFHWIVFQPDRLAVTPGLERVGAEPILLRGLDLRPLRLAAGVTAAELELPSLGYAAAAAESYAVFARLRAEGAVPAGTRFQVSLPTPVALIASFVDPADRAAFEPVYEAALHRELAEILAAVPHADLAIQWDCALEFALIEAAAAPGRLGPGIAPWFDDVWGGVLDRAARQAALVPAGVELGFHLCYGDVGERHFVEPSDAGALVRFASGLLDRVPRPITWLHLPVPIERSDDAYFAPLAGLALPAGTELYLGLVHREDGAAGAAARIETALRHAPAFGVATECGFGRAPEGTAAPLFAAHREVTAAWR